MTAKVHVTFQSQLYGRCSAVKVCRVLPRLHDARADNFLAALVLERADAQADKVCWGLAHTDLTTGSFRATEGLTARPTLCFEYSYKTLHNTEYMQNVLIILYSSR